MSKVIDVRAGDVADTSTVMPNGTVIETTYSLPSGYATFTALTESRVREIVREELAKAKPAPGEVAAHVRQLNEAVRVLGAKIRADAAFGCDIPSRTDEERRDIRDWHWKATDDVLNNPIARASVEKAGKANE